MTGPTRAAYAIKNLGFWKPQKGERIWYLSNPPTRWIRGVVLRSFTEASYHVELYVLPPWPHNLRHEVHALEHLWPRSLP